MDAAALSFAARVVLAAVLLVAAIAKMRAPEATRRQSVALVGHASGAGVAIVLPVAELAIAVLLLAWWSAVPGVIAAMLFGAFAVVVVRAHLRGLPCPCFGSRSSEAVPGSWALVRNALFLAYAVLATAFPRDARAADVLVSTVLLGGGAMVAARLAARRPLNAP